MAPPEYRLLTEALLDDLTEVMDRSRADTPFNRRLTREEARLSFIADPDFDPEGNWLVYDGDDAVGLCFAMVEKTRLAAGVNDGYLDVDVVPERRGAGLEEEMVDRCLRRLTERGVQKARTRCFEGDEWRRALLTSKSFKEAYRVYTLARRGGVVPAAQAIPDGYSIVRLGLSDCTDEVMTAVTDCLNDSFTDHYGWAPEPAERIINIRDSIEHESVISLAYVDESLIGFCWTDIDTALNEKIGEKAGWMSVLGVRGSHRRKGIGRALMVDGIRWIMENGMDTVFIQVYAKNEKALELYRAHGFERAEEHLWFHRDLSPGK